nr:hypothetical protein [Tanacetum cinerariifolium]
MEKDQTTKKPKGDELEKDNAEEQKLKEQHEAEKIKGNLEIVTDDEDDVFVNVTPLSSKPATIIFMENIKFRRGLLGNMDCYNLGLLLQLNTGGEKGINCIFVGYAEHKAYRFYVIEPNDFISINSIIKSRDAIFDENRFSLIPRPKDIIPNVQVSQMDDHTDDVTNEIPEPRKGKRVRKSNSYGFDFQIYLVEGSRDQVGSQYSYCYSIEEDPRIYNKAMQSRDAAFWKKAIDDEIGSIIENNTWVLSDLPPGCKPLGFRQKEGIDYFDTYAPVARITTIRLLFALAVIHNLVIHQMDVKTSFLNGDLDEEVYMKQPKGFVMPGNEHKVFDETKKFLLSRFSMKDMGEADVILCIKIKSENKGIPITLSYYIEKILKKFYRKDCFPVSTLMDLIEKLKPNTEKPVDQLEHSRAIGCLIQHWKAITRVFKYLRGTKDYGLSYVGYPSVLEGLDQVVNTLSLEREVNGSILTPYKAGGPFLPTVEPEAASLPLVGVRLSTSQPLPYTVEDGIGTHNPVKDGIESYLLF